MPRWRSARLAAPLLCAALAVGAATGHRAHPNSLSASRVDVRGARVVLAIEVQVLSLAEVLPGFDEDLDGRVDGARIAADAQRIADYVAAHYRLAADPGRGDSASAPKARNESSPGPEAWTWLAPTGAPRVREASLREGLFGELEQYVRVDLVYTVEGPPEALGLEVDLFADTSPEHRDLAVVVWNAVELDAFDLGVRERRVVVANAAALARGRAAFGRYVADFAGRAPREWELALLAAVLALAAPSLRKGALVTLALAAAVAVGVATAAPLEVGARGERFLTLAVPLALAYVGLDALVAKAARSRALEALVFGVVIGGRLTLRFGVELAREAPTEFQPTSELGLALFGLAVGAAGLTALAGLTPLGLSLASTSDRGAAAREALRCLGACAALGVGTLAFARAAFQ